MGINGLCLYHSDSCMYRWMVLSGLSESTILMGRYEENLQVLKLDERNLTAHSQGLQLAFLNNAERASRFISCLSKCGCLWLKPRCPPFVKEKRIFLRSSFARRFYLQWHCLFFRSSWPVTSEDFVSWDVSTVFQLLHQFVNSSVHKLTGEEDTEKKREYQIPNTIFSYCHFTTLAGTLYSFHICNNIFCQVLVQSFYS